jgi:GNAT superfamily N-acetyltransferase
LSSTRPANHHRIKPAGDSTGQPLIRVFGRHRIEGLLAAPDALVLVAADREGTAVGHLIGQFYAISAMWTGARTKLVSTYVAPEFRGRSVGGRLVEAFFAWSRERGARRFHVSAYAANEPAIRFYRRHGFAPLSVELAADA